MKKKSIVAILLTLVMCLSLSACGGGSGAEKQDSGSPFSNLAEYIIKNGEESTHDDSSCYRLDIEIEDSVDFGDVEFYALVGNEDAVCTTICVEGTTHNYPGTAINYVTLTVNEDGSFGYEDDWQASTHNIFVCESTASDYTTDTELPCVQYDGQTKEVVSNSDSPDDKNYGRNTLSLNPFLNRIDIALSTVGFGVADLGFSSFKADNEQAEKNNNLYEKNSEMNSEPVDPAVGMTKEEVLESSWGEPEDKNITEYEWGTTEQWVYNQGYIYFENGIVDAIQH